MLNLQQNRKNALDKILEIFVNCKQSTHQVTFLFTNEKSYFFQFYPTDLVNTKTTIPSGSVNSARYIPRRFAFRVMQPLFFGRYSSNSSYHTLRVFLQAPDFCCSCYVLGRSSDNFSSTLNANNF